MWSITLMIMNYFHDLAVAILTVVIMVVFIIGRYLDRKGASEEFISELFGKLSLVSYSALTFVILMGAVRAYFFMDFEFRDAVGSGQVEALVVKHIVLVGLTIFGIVGQVKYRKRYGK